MNSAEVLIKFKGDTSDVDKDTKKLTSSMGGLTKAFTLGSLAAGAVSKGFQIISAYSGRAIQRIDTMNNFPKVMQNFGVSADEASASIKRIDKSVQGLPTSLDQAVGGVQDLFMVTKDLKQSENLFKAVNDSAMVFANGSTEAVNRFIYGYKQALSAGKVSAQDFNQMNEAIPGLMSKVAEKMGVSYKELKEGLSNGSISVDQFNDALKSLDTEGVGSMESLEKSAHTATGGIQTSIENMKTAFARGIADMIKKIDEAFKPFGGLSGVISSIGKIGEKAFKKIGDILTVVVPKIIKFGQWIVKNKDLILTLVSPILAIVAAMKAYKTIMTIATVVQAAYNAVMLANPVVLIIMAIIGAITLLVAGFMYLWKHCEGFRNFWIGLWNGIVSFVKGAIDIVVSIFNGIVGFVKKNWQGLLLLLINPFAGAFKLLYDNCGAFRKFINNFVNAIKNFFSGLASKIGSAANSIVSFIKSIPSKIAGVANSIKNVFVNLPSQFLNIGSNIMKGLWNGIAGLKNWVISKVKGLGKSILNGLKSVLGIHSPSKEFALIGKFSVLGYTEALDKMSKDVDKQVASTFGISPQLTGSMQNSFSPNVNVVNNVNVEQDPLGQMVRTIKTYSGGSPNDYNYGAGY